MTAMSLSLRSCRWLLPCALAALALPARAAEVDKYLPNDTQGVLSVNVRQLLDSSLIKKHGLEQIRAGLENNQKAQDLLKSLDFDPLKDIGSITAAGPGGDDPDKGLVILH